VRGGGLKARARDCQSIQQQESRAPACTEGGSEGRRKGGSEQGREGVSEWARERASTGGRERAGKQVRMGRSERGVLVSEKERERKSEREREREREIER